MTGIQESGYTVSKHGLVAMTRAFAKTKPSVNDVEGIKCYAICPWATDTKLLEYNYLKIDSYLFQAVIIIITYSLQ
jgi:NAD(P)-dependent dehydrogenase (short-subunit alcohol dehydrogenase family)